ncbi:MAG: hypothetical protein ACTHLW_02185 [Verrucomicrobiota bacterium]
MRYDAEIVLSSAVAAYLSSILSKETKDRWPAVTFFDPMSVENADRIVVMVPSAMTMAEQPGKFVASVECVIKTEWKQATLAKNFQDHFACINETRDKLCPPDLMDRLNAVIEPGAELDFVQPARKFSTIVRTGWIASETVFEVDGFFKTEE